MTQIKPIQIIPGRENRVNPGSALPVDLDPGQRGFSTGTSAINTNTVDTLNDTAIQSTESVIADSDQPPATPAIISVKEQIVKFMPDGTAKVDVVLEIQDIAKAVEYDIRIAKDAGSV